jgi:hypothetical protein
LSAMRLVTMGPRWAGTNPSGTGLASPRTADRYTVMTAPNPRPGHGYKCSIWTASRYYARPAADLQSPVQGFDSPRRLQPLSGISHLAALFVLPPLTAEGRQ